ncbi:MAG: chemotaxis protein CheW [Polyangiaceae bacterium]
MHRHRHDPSKDFVGFVVGDVEYAVRIHGVREIANPLPVVGLPHAPREVIGVADFRGELVPVVDMRTRFHLRAVEVTRRTKWIVVDLQGTPGVGSDAQRKERLVALVVDMVTEVFGTGGADVRPAPSLGSGEVERGILGVTSRGGGLVFVLDPARLREMVDVASLAQVHEQEPS